MAASAASPSVASAPVVADRHAAEARHPDVLAQERDLLGDEVADLLVRVAVRQLQQADRSATTCSACRRRSSRSDQPGGLRLRVPRRRSCAAPRRSRRARPRAHVGRAQAGDLHRELARELLEVIGPGDEVGLAVELEQHAEPRAMMDVAGDDALAGDAAGLLGGGAEALGTQPRAAFSTSPSDASRARLQSMMPAPVWSRSCLTSSGLIMWIPGVLRC